MSAPQNRRLQGGTVVIGDLTIQGNIKGVLALDEPLTIATDNGALRALGYLYTSRRCPTFRMTSLSAGRSI